MKRIAIITCCAIMLLPACLIHAEELKVLVEPFLDSTGKYERESRDATNAALGELEKSGRFVYISDYEFMKGWLGGMAEALGEGTPTFEEFEKRRKEEPGFLRALFSHDSLGTIYENKKNWGIDFAIFNDISEREASIELHSEIISVDTGKFYELTAVTSPAELKSAAKKQMKTLLDKADELQKVKADREIDKVKSVVGYDLKLKSGDIMPVRADYTSLRPDPELQNLSIFPPRKKEAGEEIAVLETRENKPIEITYSYKNDELEYVQLDLVSPPDTGGKEYSESLTVESEGGYVLEFTFCWKNNKLTAVSCLPLVNPYNGTE